MTEERRVVTVLFADVVGSTGIGENLDPEDLRHLLSIYFAAARDVIEEHGGTLEKFIGDAVMAIFGLPRAHDDDAQRALATALRMRDRLRADSRLADRLPVRIGINTGEVVSGVNGSAEQPLITGDAVNVAARLQQQAAPWSILVGERTVLAAGGAFSFGPRRQMEVRGRTRSVGANELLASRAPTPAIAPFVGREADLAQLELLARRAFSERRPWLTTIVGAPGAGKSRLVAEFISGLRSNSPHVSVIVARCLPYGQQLTYGPLREVLSIVIGVPEDAPADQVIDATANWLQASGVSDARRVAVLLGTTIGVTVSQPPVSTEVFGAWRTLVEAAAGQGPLVLAIEDLHWSSDSLLDLLEFAMQPRRDVPALLLAIARPELLDRRLHWGAGRRNHTSLSLAPLAPEAIASIVEHLLPSSGRDLVDSVVHRAEGNPFFAGEMVRSLVERSGSGAAIATGMYAARQLPDTIQATIQARLDLLEPAERRVLQAGAVFGRAFGAAGVAAILDTDVTDVASIIDSLLDRDLVAHVDDGEVAARHILIRDVAYQTLPRTDRAAAHAAAARWIAEHSSAEREPTELIAFHYREAAALLSAMDAPPPSVTATREEAVTWLRRAADRALGSAASAEAVAYLRSAIELADQNSLPELYERLGDAHLQGELTADAYRHGLEVATDVLAPPDVRLRVLGKLLMQYTRSQGAVAKRPSPEEMGTLRAAGWVLLPSVTDDQAAARFLIADAFYPFWAGRSDDGPDRADARESARRGLAIAERLDDADLRSAALDALTALSDTWQEALGNARDRLASQDRLALVERIDAYSMVAWPACTVGQLSEAAEVAAAGLGLIGAGQIPTYALHLAAWRAYALNLLGRWDELDRVADQALGFWEATDRSPAAFAVRGFIAAFEASRARGDAARAKRSAHVVREIVAHFPTEHLIRRSEAFLEPDIEALAALVEDTDVVIAEERVLGRVDYIERALTCCLDHGRYVPADALIRIGRTAERFGCRLLQAQVRRGIGLARSEPDELRAALAGFEAADARPLVARALIELGRMTGAVTESQRGLEELRRLGDVEYLLRAGATVTTAP